MNVIKKTSGLALAVAAAALVGCAGTTDLTMLSLWIAPSVSNIMDDYYLLPLKNRYPL